MGRVENKVAVVTGGAKGIGKAACSILAEHGAKVAVTDIDEGNGRRLAKEINNQGGTAEFWHLNTSHEGQVERVFEEVNEQFGALQVLVNNAGISGANKPTHEITAGEWDEVMEVNVKGVFLCTKYVIPYMQRAGGGSIIMVGSQMARVANPLQAAYCTTKAAMVHLAKGIALEYAADKIRANALSPGGTATSRMERQFGTMEKAQEVWGHQHPLGRLGTPEEIANGAIFLASDESAFMTGADLLIDGGYAAR